MRLGAFCNGFLVLLNVGVLAATCSSQKAAGQAFDVSSVKPSKVENSKGYIRRLDVGTVSVVSMTVDDMIGLFYHVRPYQLAGGPDWVKRERFDVTGKDSVLPSSAQKPAPDAWAVAMDANDEKMRELLGDRFALKLHHEVKVLPMYLLLTDSKKQFLAVPCSAEYRLQAGVVKGAIRAASLAALLKAELGIPVRDSTGLTGCYSMDAHWAIDPTDDSLPSIATALHDIGFRLEKSKGDVDTLVIDHVERPRPD